MPNTARIPRTIDEFNRYMVNTDAYLLEGTPVTNGIRLGLLETEITQWSAFKTDWIALYVKYSDETNTRTKAIRDKLVKLMDDIVEYDLKNHILDRIAASPNVTIDDLEIFHIKKGALQKTARTTTNTGIHENVTVTLQPLGGGLISVKCYSITGQRAAIFEDADCVQYAYLIGDTPPVSSLDPGLIRDLSTKASFTLSLGSDQAKKMLYIYFRWYNTHHPDLAGPWSAMQNTVII